MYDYDREVIAKLKLIKYVKKKSKILYFNYKKTIFFKLWVRLRTIIKIYNMKSTLHPLYMFIISIFL